MNAPPEYAIEDDTPMLQEVISDPLPHSIVPSQIDEPLVIESHTVTDPHSIVLYRTQADCCLKSTIKHRRTEEGVQSQRQKLYRSPDHLWRFLMHHAKERPSLKLVVKGDCSEFQDFELTIDLTNYVDANWSYVSCSSEYSTVSQMIQKFCYDTTSNKEFIGQKTIVGWCEDEVLSQICQLVRSQYQHNISVYFDHSNDKIRVIKKTWTAWAAQSRFMKFFCLFTCLWIICWPFYCCVSKKVTRTLAINYQIRTTQHYFLEQVGPLIIDTVRYKRKATIEL